MGIGIEIEIGIGMGIEIGIGIGRESRVIPRTLHHGYRTWANSPNPAYLQASKMPFAMVAQTVAQTMVAQTGRLPQEDWVVRREV